MNRLEHLKKTLPRYLETCAQAQEGVCELLLINYNSQDGMDEYIRREHSEAITQGRLRYFHTEDPVYYNGAHARNIAIKLAKGEFYCNIDADTWFDLSFIELLSTLKLTQCLTARDGKLDDGKARFGIAGRICCAKQVLYELRGYDEKTVPIEDADLKGRLKRFGLEMKITTKASHLSTIPHSNKKRIENLDPALGQTLKESRGKAQSYIRANKYTLIRNESGWGQAIGLLDLTERIVIE